jgi:hypothetical protein
MPDGNIGLLEEYPPAIGTGTLPPEAILSYFMEQLQLQPKVKKLLEHRAWIRVEDPTSDNNICISTTEPAWLLKAKYDLTRLATLPENWDSYGSPSVRTEILNNAEHFLNNLDVEKIPPPFVAPVSGGGIQFEWSNGDRELEVEFIELHVFGYLKIVKDEIVEQGDFSTEDYNSAHQLIRWLKYGQS